MLCDGSDSCLSCSKLYLIYYNNIMEQFSKSELEEALISLQSTLSKCEKVIQNLPTHTLTIRRIKALKIAILLINEKLISYK